MSAPTQHNVSIRLYEAPTARGRGRLKILLLKLDHIGDFITAIEAFRVMRRAFAGAEITLLCLPGVVALAQSTGLFDHVKGFAGEQDSSQIGKAPKMSLEDQLAMFMPLLDGPYFLAVDFKHDVSTRHWLDHVDAELRAGYAAITQKGLDIVLPPVEWKIPGQQVEGKNLPVHAETRLTLLAHLIDETLHEKTLDADLFKLPQDLTEIPAWLALRDEARMKIGVSLGAGSELRQWKPDYWVALLRRLHQTYNAVLVFFGGPDDKVATQELIARLDPASALDLTAAFPLPYVAAYMGLLDAYIGCDTGLTHLAGALGVPTVNIFAGISNVSVWRARGPRVKTVYAQVICAPCHLRFKKDCPNGTICMTAIVPDIVHACFEQVIAPR